MRGPRFFLGLLIVAVISTSYIFVKQFSFHPRFLIANNTVENVTVVAEWRDQERDLGIIEPGSTLPLTVRDEASMVFRVRYTDGRVTESKPIYFTSGVIISVDISTNEVIAKHNADT